MFALYLQSHCMQILVYSVNVGKNWFGFISYCERYLGFVHTVRALFPQWSYSDSCDSITSFFVLAMYCLFYKSDCQRLWYCIGVILKSCEIEMTYINIYIYIYIYIYTGGLFTEIVVYVLLCCKCIYIILQEAYICFFFG